MYSAAFAPRPLAPAPADDGEFTEDLSAAREVEPHVASPRRSRGGRRQERGRDDGRSQRPRASGIPGERGEGVIRAMNPERGFGFIETPAGDIFFHKTSVKGGFEALNPGTRVVFVFGEGDRGSKAEDVMAV
jgi:CspA family cold shock protein